MSFGLKTYDSSGNLSLDTNYQISRIHSIISVSCGSGSSATYAVTGMENDGTWHPFINNTASNSYISINSGSFTISVPNIYPALSGATCTILRSNGQSQSSGYGFYAKNENNQVQIDQDFSNYAYIGGSSGVSAGNVQTLPSGYNFSNSLLLVRPATTTTIYDFVVVSNNTFRFNRTSGATYDWVCFAPASSISLSTNTYGMRVYNASGNTVFDTGLRYLKYAESAIVPLSGFSYTTYTTPLANEKVFTLVNNFGVLSVVYTGIFVRTTLAAINTTNNLNINVTTGIIQFPSGGSGSFSYGSNRRYDFFHCIPA